MIPMRPQGQYKYQFPWRSGNEFELLVNGERYFPEMLRAIEQARDYILLEMYLVESGEVAKRFIDALTTASRRGVLVKLLLDDFGSRGLNAHDRYRLQRNNVEIIFYNLIRFTKWFRNMARDHRKLLLVDGNVAFVGGTGITDDFSPLSWKASGNSWIKPGFFSQHIRRDKTQPWRETMIRINGPVLQDWQDLFLEVWDRHAKFGLQLPNISVQSSSGTMLGHVTMVKGLAHQGITRSIVKHIRSAKKRIWFSSAYFIPSWKIRRSLRRAATLGLDVRLLLAGPRTDHPAVRYAGRRYYSRLLRNGIRIFEYQPSNLHSKVVLCDQWVSIGSSNLDRWNLRWNLEANQSIDNPQFAEAVKDMFEEDFAHSKEYHYEQWVKRSWILRVRERIWGKVDLWLHRLGKGRRRN